MQKGVVKEFLVGKQVVQESQTGESWNAFIYSTEVQIL